MNNIQIGDTVKFKLGVGRGCNSEGIIESTSRHKDAPIQIKLTKPYAGFPIGDIVYISERNIIRRMNVRIDDKVQFKIGKRLGEGFITSKSSLNDNSPIQVKLTEPMGKYPIDDEILIDECDVTKITGRRPYAWLIVSGYNYRDAGFDSRVCETEKSALAYLKRNKAKFNKFRQLYLSDEQWYMVEKTPLY